MCRIIGHVGGRPSRTDLVRAARRQRAGGPDEQSLATGPDWALGANRLAITDPDGGRQPYALGDDLLVVLNGEIYNHDELRRRVRGWGYPVPDRCDGSVLPALYDRYGEAFTDHLDGMYAIAVLDLRGGEPTLVLATDHAGMKPLYYGLDPTGRALSFASELRALRELPGVDDSLWSPGLEAYLATKAVLGDRTMFSGIRVVPRSTTLVFSRRDGLRVRTRPDRAAPEAVTAPPGTDLAGAGERTRALMGREVARLSAADVPVCSVLSGGLDSSLVTAMLARDVTPLHTFSVRYAGRWPSDETAYARAVADQVGTVHHTVTVDPTEFPAILDGALDALGQPNADPIVVSTHALFRAVRAAGFPVALTGDGADEVFLGYDRMVAAVRAHESGEGWRDTYLDALAAIPRAARLALYTPEYRHHAQASAGAGDLLGTGDPAASFGPLEVGERLPAYHLRRVDHLAMASGVEARVPFCQRSVQELAGSLAPGHRLHGGEVKRALRRAGRGLVPGAVLDRPKQPFTLPVAAMLRTGSELLDYASDLLAPGALGRDGQLCPRAVGTLLRTHRAEPTAASALAVWSLTVYQAWRSRLTTTGRTEVAA